MNEQRGTVGCKPNNDNDNSQTMSEGEFFAVPPAGEPEEPVGEEPIVLGPPGDDAFAAPPAADAFAAPPTNAFADYQEPAAYLGDVNENTEDEIPPVAESSEPTPMQVWNTGWQETLKQRKDEETAVKAELLEKAKTDLEAFQKEREQKRESIMAKNREDEQVKLEAIEADLENDNSWQRVCKLVELQHDSSEKAEDVKRMRDVMILLKNDPTKAQTLTA